MRCLFQQNINTLSKSRQSNKHNNHRKEKSTNRINNFPFRLHPNSHRSTQNPNILYNIANYMEKSRFYIQIPMSMMLFLLLRQTQALKTLFSTFPFVVMSMIRMRVMQSQAHYYVTQKTKKSHYHHHEAIHFFRC